MLFSLTDELIDGIISAMENQEKKHKRRVRYSGTHPKTYKEKYKENIEQHNKRICTIALEWINQMDEIYFLNGRLEFKNYEMNIDPFIKMNNFAKWCAIITNIIDTHNFVTYCFKYSSQTFSNNGIFQMSNMHIFG